MRHTADFRKLAKPLDLLWIGLVAAACLITLAWINRPSGTSGTAEIRMDGAVLRRIELAQAPDGSYRLEENPGVGYQIKDHAIRFVDTNCPDKLCEKAGYISHPGQAAVCLPNQVGIQIVGAGDEGLDAVVN